MLFRSIAIAIYSLVQSPTVTLGVAGFILGMLIFTQTRRWLDTKDVLIFIGIVLAIVLFVPALQSTLTIPTILFLALVASAGAIALTALFMLIYKLLAAIF